MRFDTSQHMKLNQQMKLAPRMIQSMEILQMPMLALQERIEQELESNVALEQVEPGLELDQIKADQQERERDETSGERELVVGDDTPSGAEDFERLDSLETSYGEAFDYSSSTYSASRMAGERDRKMDAMASIVARSESLTEQLLHQWSLAEIDAETAAIGQLLIGYIDDDGLLSESLQTILEQNQGVPGLQLSVEGLEETLHTLQSWLEPAGLAARDRREALLLEVDDLELKDETESHNWDDVRLIIEHHFEDLIENRLPRIAQRTDLSMDRIHDAMDLMKKLNLTPGRDLVDRDVPPVIPDVIVDFDEERDQYIAALADGLMPTLRVSPRYETMSRDRSVEKGTRDFVSDNVRRATWLIDSINQRSSTLLRVVNVVLARQRDFLDHGRQHLRPLPMIEVADQLGVHVATVSRAVADKWMQTPRGLFPLRMFFSGGTSTESGEQMSWEAVKATLQEIIDAEDKAKPMSDESLSAALKDRGIDIARRTVVKYRQQMGIPAARKRKTF